MKRIGYIYEKIIDLKNLELAIVKACEHKKKNKFIVNLLNNKSFYAQEIRTLILKGEFHPLIIKRKRVKETTKVRDIAVPKFYPDQIIHWAVCLQLNQIFMKGMYKYNCGSIPNRGGVYAKKYIEKCYSLLKEKKSYTLKLDIKKYFYNISHEKIEELFREKIKDKKVLEILHRIIDCGEDGLPIGFYTSQWFANFYLHKLDNFIKQTLQIKYYVRYVDDMVLIDTNKRKLHKAVIEIQKYLDDNNYYVKLKDNWQLWKTFSRPLDFLGFRFYKNYTLLRKGILKKLKRQVMRVGKEKTLRICRARALTSYMGWLKQTSVSRSFYVKHIKPTCSKKWVGRIISHDSKRRNKNDSKRRNKP